MELRLADDTAEVADSTGVAFGEGPRHLVISLVVLAVTVSPAWAATTYVVLALLAVAIVALSPDFDPGRRR